MNTVGSYFKNKRHRINV